jgi:hypothetical protein
MSSGMSIPSSGTSRLNSSIFDVGDEELPKKKQRMHGTVQEETEMSNGMSILSSLATYGLNSDLNDNSSMEVFHEQEPVELTRSQSIAEPDDYFDFRRMRHFSDGPPAYGMKCDPSCIYCVYEPSETDEEMEEQETSV